MEVEALDFEGTPPAAADLGQRWHAALDGAAEACKLLPAREVGRCVLARSAELFRGGTAALAAALAGGDIRFHAGRIGGSWPRVVA